jgi:cell division transport system permease protein
MAIKLDYVARETGSNLFRNFTITLASVMTVAVSLALVGASLMAQQGVDRATKRWQGGVEFIVFLNPTATPEQVESVNDDLKKNPGIDKITFVDKNQAYAEFKELFRDSPEMIEAVTPDILPASYRVEPKDKTAETITQLSDEYKVKPGVKQVVSATDTIRLVQRFSEFLTKMILVVAIVLLGAALLLILNTIRMAMYARRREIEVMKLVGATNWFIRVPFMAEGLVQGVVGAGLAIGGLAVFRPIFEGWLPPAEQFPIFSGFVPASSDMLPIYLLLGLVGCLVGATGAGVAVTRFLDV